MNLYKKIKPKLFRMDAEDAHNLIINVMKKTQSIPFIDSCLQKKYCVQYPSLHQRIYGLNFYNPIGLASGFDKNAEVIKPMRNIGFGFLELGSITFIPQSGNDRPRIWRHVAESSLQNHLGFNNIGAKAAAKNLAKHYPFSIPLGVNIGRNKDLNNQDSLKNYERSLRILSHCGDYFAFNLSSPNTPNLRDLQNESFVKELLQMAKSITSKPVFIKISPDMNVDSMLEVVQSAIDSGADGIVATNTTIEYGLLQNPFRKNGQNIGGISGEVLSQKSREILKILGKHFFKKTTLISVGGICSASEAYLRLGFGASLIQILSGMIYHGPALVASMNKELDSMLKADGFSHISQVIGSRI